MTRREGETEQGSEVSEGPEETLEDYREGVNDKYAEDGEKKDKSGEAGGEGDGKEEKEPAGNSEGNDAAESESGTENVDKAPERQAGDSSQTGSQEGQEARPDLSETNADREDFEPKEESPSDEKTSGGDELESMREHLNEKYPRDEKDATEREETQPAIPPAGENEGEVDPTEPNPTESSKQQNAEANGVSTEGQTDTPANNAAERPKHDLSAQEDVGWRTPEGHATPDKPQDPPRGDEIQPNEVGSPHAAVENGDSKQPQNESKEERAKPAETSPSDETQAGKVEPAKTDTNDQSASNKPLADTGETGGENPDNPLQIHAEKPAGGTSGSDNAGNHGIANAKEEKSSLEGQDKAQVQADAKGGGNQPPEHDKPMPAADGPPNGPRDGDKEDGEGDDQQSMVIKASTYMESLALNIPSRAIPKHENRDDVYEVRISRVSNPEEEYKVYTTHNPNYKRAYLPIRHVGAEKGEEFNVKKPERYEESDFARDYNASKPKGLENTSLEYREGKFMLKVDGTEFALKEASLRAQEGKAVLDGKLNDEDKNEMKIAKGIDGFDVRLKSDHAVVTSMKESKEGLTMSYERTHHDEFPHVRLVKVENLERVDSGKLESWEHKAKFNSEEIRLEKPVGPLTDSIKMEFSEANARKAWEYWSSATSQSERFYHQGDVGEAVARIALEKSGFKTFPKEISVPSNARSYAHESEMPGPDIVVYGSVGGTEGYHICQVKHWRESAKALKEGREDAMKFRDSLEDRPLLEQTLGGKILGSFIIELDWSYKDSVGIIYSEHIEY